MSEDEKLLAIASAASKASGVTSTSPNGMLMLTSKIAFPFSCKILSESKATIC